MLSASRLSQPVTEAPAAVYVIDREMIEASGARQIADLFRLVPGFTVAYHNGYTPSVTYHGMADEFSRRMQALEEGRLYLLYFLLFLSGQFPPGLAGRVLVEFPVLLAQFRPDSIKYVGHQRKDRRHGVIPDEPFR